LRKRGIIILPPLFYPARLPLICETLEPSTFFPSRDSNWKKLYENSTRIEAWAHPITHLFLQREEWEHECLGWIPGKDFCICTEHPDLLQRVPQKISGFLSEI